MYNKVGPVVLESLLPKLAQSQNRLPLSYNLALWGCKAWVNDRFSKNQDQVTHNPILHPVALPGALVLKWLPLHSVALLGPPKVSSGEASSSAMGLLKFALAMLLAQMRKPVSGSASLH